MLTYVHMCVYANVYAYVYACVHMYIGVCVIVRAWVCVCVLWPLLFWATKFTSGEHPGPDLRGSNVLARLG